MGNIMRRNTPSGNACLILPRKDVRETGVNFWAADNVFTAQTQRMSGEVRPISRKR